MNETNIINSFTGKYAFLSNFYPSPITIDNIQYPTVEHAFQAQKTLDIKERIKISKIKDPGSAKAIGRKVKLRVDWEEIKMTVMRKCLKEKFKDPYLQESLIETGTAKLIEGNFWNDTYWGICNGIGENHLGQLLMEIRNDIWKKYGL